MDRIDIKTLHGHLFTCEKCNKLHFEFNQIAIDFSSPKILENFYNYLDKLDSDEFDRVNKNSHYIRKIQIPFPNTAIKLVLSQTDLKELKVLIKIFLTDHKEIELKTQLIKKLSHISKKQLN